MIGAQFMSVLSAKACKVSATLLASRRGIRDDLGS